MQQVAPYNKSGVQNIINELRKDNLQKYKSRKNKNPEPYDTGLFAFALIQSGDALLSHGETPHYHRHYGILLLSSEWIQVELPHYGRQNILLMIFCISLFFVLLFFNSKQASEVLSFGLISFLFSFSLRLKTLERCIVKPLGQLVCVSSTARTAYTPHLSTS